MFGIFVGQYQSEKYKANYYNFILNFKPSFVRQNPYITLSKIISLKVYIQQS